MSVKLEAKPKKGAVLAVEIVMTASNEFFAAGTEVERAERLQMWIDLNVHYLDQRYGVGNVVNVLLHLDERTPHLHAVIVPLVFKADGRERRDPRRKWRLAADDMVGGNRQRLTDDQTHYAEAMAPLGLTRGIEGSGKQHRTAREWEIDQAAALAANRRIGDELAGELASASTATTEVQRELAEQRRLTETQREVAIGSMLAALAEADAARLQGNQDAAKIVADASAVAATELKETRERTIEVEARESAATAQEGLLATLRAQLETLRQALARKLLLVDRLLVFATTFRENWRRLPPVAQEQVAPDAVAAAKFIEDANLFRMQVMQAVSRGR